jgi:hypothetical protein
LRYVCAKFKEGSLKGITAHIKGIIELIRSLTKEEEKAFHLHLFYVIFEAIVLGVFALNEYVFIKGMNGSDFQLSYLMMFNVAVLFFSVFINEFIKRFKNSKKLIRYTAFITHLPLLIIAVFPTIPETYQENSIWHSAFLAIFFMYFMNKVIALPKINLILKSVYRHEVFGELFSLATSVNKIVRIVVVIGFGLVLDLNNFAFTWMYPIMGVVGIASFYALSFIEFEDPEQKLKLSAWKSITSSIDRMVRILKTDKSYLHFQAGFMFYGLAWMLTAAMIPIYFDEVFELNNKSYSFYKIIYDAIAIVLLPFFGILISKIDPRRFASITFAAMALHILFLAITQYWDAHIVVFGYTFYASLLISYFFYGIFSATMALLWFIGSAYFCKKEEVGDYQSVHLTLTGFRGLFGFIAGIALYHLIGYTWTFAIGFILLVLGIILMEWSKKRIALVKQQ